MNAQSDRNETLIAAIHEDRLADLDDPAARRACHAIGARMNAEVTEVVARLRAVGIDPSVPSAPTLLQRHAAELGVQDASEAARAAAALADRGFVVWEPTMRGAGRVHARCHAVLTLARTTDVTVAVRLRWETASRPLPGALVPNHADFSAVDLPASLWPLYFVVRPLRLIAERAGLRTPAAPVLGPFLSTPNDIIPALLELARVTSEDTIADLGCGDGRILVQAVEQIGCRAIGVESDPDLVVAARKRAKAAGVGDRVRIIEGDAASAEIGQATTVFVFLPADATVALVRQLRSTLEAGTRIIAHEQHRLPQTIDGVASTALVHQQGVTVAHQWIVGR